LPRYRLADCWPAGSAASGWLPLAETIESPRPAIEPVDEPILAEATGEAVRPMPGDLLPPDFGAAADGGGGVAVVTLPEPREPPTAAEPGPLPTSDVLPPNLDEDRQAAGGTGVTPVAHKAESGTGVPPVAHRAAMTFDHRYWLSLAYTAGGLACLVWLALGRVLLLRMVWSARTPEPWLREVCRQISFGRRRPRLLISDRCTRALSFGIWRSTIVLPADACRADRAQALRYVLMHELAHARQRDGWGHLLFNLAFPLLYFHPLYWWIRSRAYLAAELIADDWAAGRTAKESYVEALIALAKGGGRRQLACGSSPGVFGSRSQFYRRMQMLLDRESRLARRCSPRWCLIYPAACLLAVLLVAGTVGVRPAEAESDEPAAPATTAVAEPAAASEQTTEPAAAAEPAIEGTTEPVAPPPKPSPAGVRHHLLSSDPEVLNQGVRMLEMRNDELMRLLASMQATIADLRKELDALKAERAPARGGFYGPRTVTPWPTAPSVPAATPAAPGAIPAPPGMPVLPTQPTPLGAAPPAPPVPASGPMLPGTLLPPATAALVTPVPIEPRFAATTRSTYFPGASDGRRMPEGTQLDLVSLATSYADAVGEVEIAKLEYESRKQLAERNTIPAQELAIAEIKFKAAERKVALLRNIAEAALMETKADMDAARSQLESVSKGRPDDQSAIRAAEAQVIRAQSRLRVLESILALGGR